MDKIGTTKLLDKLYNLRGDDSEILISMEKDKQAAIDTRERTTEEKNTLQDKITSLQNDEAVLNSEGEELKKVLENIDTSKFSNVLNRLNVEFNPTELYHVVCEKLPEEIESVKNEYQNAVNELETVEEQMNKAITEIDELALRKEEAIANQRKLNEYFELSLSGNNSLTRETITELLAKFGFDNEEQREAAKLLMFPEDSLYEYDKKVNHSNTVKTEQKISETQSVIEPTPIVTELPTDEPKAVENHEEAHHFSPTDYEDMVKSINSITNENEDVKMCLNHVGLDANLFNEKDIAYIKQNLDDLLIVKNVDIAKKNNIDLDLFIDNPKLLVDNEFGQKLEKLLEVGKAPLDVYLSPDILLKYDLSGLNNAIVLLQSNGLDPRKVPLIAY